MKFIIAKFQERKEKKISRIKRKKTMSTNDDNAIDDENMHTLKKKVLYLSLSTTKNDEKFHENKQVEMSMA